MTLVTTDLAVLQGWPSTNKKLREGITSALVAQSLKLTVFQVTARLKGMEGRGFLERNEQGNWSITAQGLAERANPSPSVSGTSKTMRHKDSTGQHSGTPDDAKVPMLELQPEDFAPRLAAVEECRRRLPEVEAKLAAYDGDTQRFSREILALTTERDHCYKIMKMPRKGKWTSRIEHTKTGAHSVYVAPDQREYVMAAQHETADVLIKSRVRGIPPVRLRLYSTSAAAKAAKRAHSTEQEQENRKLAKEQETRNVRIIQEEAKAAGFALSRTGNAKETEKQKSRPRAAGRKAAVAPARKLHPNRDRGGHAALRRAKKDPRR